MLGSEHFKGDIMDDIARQMICTNRSIRRFMDGVSESLNLSASQGRILVFIAMNNMNKKKIKAQDIAHEFNMKRSSVSEHLKCLENLGYIKRIDQEDDKRSKGLFVTNKGQELVEEMKIRFQKNEAYLNSLLNEEEKENFIKTLQKIRLSLKEDFNV